MTDTGIWFREIEMIRKETDKKEKLLFEEKRRAEEKKKNAMERARRVEEKAKRCILKMQNGTHRLKEEKR